MLREDEEIPRGVQERTPGEQVDSSDVVLSEISRSTGIGKYRGGQSKGGLGGTKRAQGSAKGPQCEDQAQKSKKNHQVGQHKDVWGDLWGAREPKGAPKGPKAKIRRCQDDPMRGARAKIVKSEELLTLLKGSWRGSREAKSRTALTLQRFGGSGGK